MLNECLATKCDDLKIKAQDVIDDVSDRKHNYAKPQELVLEPEAFLAKRHTHLEEAVAFEKAALCMQECQLPVDITKRILAANVRELETNLSNCVSGCNSMSTDEKLFVKEIGECKITCFESNKLIAKEIEANLGATLPRYKSQLADLL